DNIVGVLLRVDSPGGGASASQELYMSLKRLAQKKTMVVSMGSVAASGGYMLSMAGERIFANASTITGSIGVRMDIPQIQNLMRKIGISQETLVTGPYKDAASMFRPLSQEEKKYLQRILDDLHMQFVEIVAKGRNLTVEQAQKFATGRIFTGREALHFGLIDELGGQEEAHAWLAQKTGVALTKELIKEPKKNAWYEEALKTLLNFGVGAMVQDNTSPVFLYLY
ncbi:MAG: signal peptide peptidase SppA, partial [Desulfovibrio sp.]|nr:signal peptide peptidase SppA [Desulfovibrio sp.]